MVIIHGMEGAVDVCLSYGICNCSHPPPVFRVLNPSFFKEIICEDPGVPVNGYKTNAKLVYHLNDTVYFHCNDGYTMNGSISNFCTESGEWAHPVPVCGESTTTQDTTTMSTTEPTTSHPTTTTLATSTTQDTTKISTTEPTTSSHPPTTTLRTCTWPGYIPEVVQYVNGLETNKLATYYDELPEGTFLVSRCTFPGEYVLRGSSNRTCSDGSWAGEQPSCVPADTRIVFKDYRPLEFRSNGTIIIQPRSQLIIYCHVPSNKVARFESQNGLDAVYLAKYGPSTMVIRLSPPRTSHSGRFTCRSDNSTLSHTAYVQFAGN
ncbi:CUB and sushi domain-containing protein 3-like [Strongylocentrotus purpuratus]|uniref:Sushi domain-containing protein n=1 Tax=Strongylocentrotus purpuratus TaxID=7668 RepID=A0A7M7PES4_STRPU|nr:CUB and sushi domain-containing protein 3-like [Strongylocentrotus purpuratus]